MDDYTFNLRLRPPTRTLDLLTTYLEVKYADILLWKDAVQTLQRQIAIQNLTQNPNASEALESPPAALTSTKTLSLAEREGITQTLGALLDGHLYRQYRDAVMQLYCDGLVSWDELQQCWAAAEAGEELAAAENAGDLAGKGLLSALCYFFGYDVFKSDRAASEVASSWQQQKVAVGLMLQLNNVK